MSEEYIFLNKFAGLEEYNDLFDPHQEYQSFVRFFETGIIDRTHTLDSGFKYKVLDPIPNHKIFEESFDVIMTNRAHECVKVAKETGRKISVLWSGGIDSTGVLLALIDILGIEAFRSNAEILLSQESTKEFPELFKFIIQNKLKIIPVTHPVSRYLNSNNLNVSGEHGDQLFGSDKMLTYVESGLGEIKYQDIIPVLMMDKLGKAKKVDDLFSYIDPVMNKAPFKISTICDYLWWVNFVFKWQQVSLRIAVWSIDNIKPIYESLFHFYRCEEFQKWSLNQNSKNPNHINLYKKPLKDHIQHHFNCDRYLESKTKEISLRPKGEKKFWHLNRNKWSFIIDADWRLSRRQIINEIY